MRESNYDKVIKLFNPDKEGKSQWVGVDFFRASGLSWSTNGHARHGVFFNVREFLWEKKPDNRGAAVTHLRTVGLRVNDSFKQTITSSVKQHFASRNICSLSLIPIPPSLREIDHRYGNKTHPDYIAIYSKENQKPEDFQLIFSVLNSAKRQICIECCANLKRPAHPTLGFIEGDENHADRFPCGGCYLAEPEKYRNLPYNH